MLGRYYKWFKPFFIFQNIWRSNNSCLSPASLIFPWKWLFTVMKHAVIPHVINNNNCKTLLQIVIFFLSDNLLLYFPLLKKSSNNLSILVTVNSSCSVLNLYISAFLLKQSWELLLSRSQRLTLCNGMVNSQFRSHWSIAFDKTDHSFAFQILEFSSPFGFSPMSCFSQTPLHCFPFLFNL